MEQQIDSATEVWLCSPTHFCLAMKVSNSSDLLWKTTGVRYLYTTHQQLVIGEWYTSAYSLVVLLTKGFIYVGHLLTFQCWKYNYDWTLATYFHLPVTGN